jgi:hypothetical protein
MATCRSCRASIFWAETLATATKAGRRIPLDTDPDNPAVAGKFDNGNVVFIGTFTGDGTPIVKIVGGAAGRARPHWASCPNAPRHRRS